ncbi:MAG: DUF1523 family protein [Pseudomonadota bacterium]
MRWPRIIFLLVVATLVGAFLSYTLPQRDVVYVTGTEVIRQDLSGLNQWFYARGDSGSAQANSRDIRFINTVRPDGTTVSVYRNEDTGFLWPPYFKFASQDLQAEASNLTSTGADPQWVVITHYGWRSNLFSIYPNAVAMRPVETPDVALFPWPILLSLLGIAILIFVLWRLWERFEDGVIEPLWDGLAVRWAKTRDWMAGRR